LHQRLLAVIARNEVIHGLPRFARNDKEAGGLLRPASGG
jgi:hypothetical protein